MRILIAITTYQRKEYLQGCIKSLFRYHQPHHAYHVAVNDDGSTDGSREWLKALQGSSAKPINFSIHLTFSNNKGVHHADNNLILYANSLNYDYGFKMDDDVFVTKQGWEDLYINSGLEHAVHFSTEWAEPKQRIRKGNLISYASIMNVQGAFWTFTPSVLKAVGFMDTQTMGRRGHGHIDFTARACRAGFNVLESVFDVIGSGAYIKYQPRKGYQLTPNYDTELKTAAQDTPNKIEVLRNPNRVFVPLKKSVLSHFFEHIYVISLPNRTDRRRRMEHNLTRHGIYDVEFFDAIDGKQHHNPDYWIKAGELGCLMSHLAVVDDAKKRGFESILILEDDLIFHKDFHATLLNLYSVPRDWDMLYLGASDFSYQTHNVGNVDFRDTFYRASMIDGTFAYGLTKRMIDNIVGNRKNIKNTRPIDTNYHYFHAQYKAYILDPMPFIADVSNSDIRQPRNIQDNAKKVNWNLKNYNP